MSERKRALLIVGSPKRRESTSHVLASALADRLGTRGWETEEIFAVMPRPRDADMAALAAAVDAADLVVVVCPLYVDQLPAGVIAALEQIHARRDERSAKPRRLAGIVNCGFPESVHNDTALAVLKRFAELDGLEWAGGLSRGMGGAIAGRPLEKVGRVAFGVPEALDLAAEALARGAPVPADAMSRMATPPIPKWLYLTMGNLGWLLNAFRNGVLFSAGKVPPPSV